MTWMNTYHEDIGNMAAIPEANTPAGWLYYNVYTIYLQIINPHTMIEQQPLAPKS